MAPYDRSSLSVKLVDIRSVDENEERSILSEGHVRERRDLSVSRTVAGCGESSLPDEVSCCGIDETDESSLESGGKEDD